MPNEADTCRQFVLPRLQRAGWDTDPRSLREQVIFTDGRIIPGPRIRRRPRKRCDYLLCYTRDYSLAVVEAKPTYATPGHGLQQAKAYPETLDLPFAYATTGHAIIEHDYLTGHERELTDFPTPDELWSRLRATRPLSRSPTRRRLAASRRRAGLPTTPIRTPGTEPACPQRRGKQNSHPSDASPRSLGLAVWRFFRDGQGQNYSHRHRQDHRRLPNLLEALEHPLEPYRPAPPPQIQYTAPSEVVDQT